MHRSRPGRREPAGAGPVTELPELEIIDVGVDRRGVHDPADRLSLHGVGVRYGNRRVVHDVTLRVAPGEVVVLIGHNGCGKSSTLRATYGLCPVDGGEVVIEGVDVSAESSAARRELGVAFVPATGEVFDDLTVEDNLVLAAGPRLARDEVVARIDEVIGVFGGIVRNLRRPAGILSGGEQRMVGVGMALMTHPRLLLLDEPSKHLAPATAAGLLAAVAGHARERGTSVLVAEVNVTVALAHADRAYVMRSGEVLREERAADLLAAGPSTWWTLF